MVKKRKSHLSWASVSRLAVLLGIVFSVTKVSGQQSLESNFRMSGEGITGAFEEQREVIQKVSAVIYDGRDEIAYGIVVSEDGYILTKASEIEGIGNLDVRVDRDSFKEVKVVMVDTRWDVALLKVDAKDLVPADFAPDSDLAQGSWVIVNGATSRTRRRALAGVISANSREIAPAGGAVLGVQITEDEGKLEVKEVAEGSGAEEAGMQEGDIIAEVEGESVGKLEDLAKVIGEKEAGSTVRIKVKREKEELELDVRLSVRGELYKQLTRNDMMSGDFSERRSGFPRVIQHDVLANSDTMGGPVLDFEGKVIGMNIARANRAETFAIPVEELRELAEGMLAQARK